MASLLKIQTSMVGTESELAQLILVTLQPAPAVVYFFQVGVLFNIKNAKFLACFGQIWQTLSRIFSLFGVFLTGLDIVQWFKKN